jgi:methionyl-tRNA formyltransferase
MKIYRAERMTASDLTAFTGASSFTPGAAASDWSLLTPGTVISDGKSLLAVATADGAIRICELQLAGKKRMDVEAFLLGFRNPQSYVCTPGTSKAVLDSVRS